jgi:uncharacterized protein (DUF2236 family)
MLRKRREATQLESSRQEAGLFGPGSESWRVLRERSVVMGGMRALLMHAVHPLVAAAAAQTRMYEHDPWGRHERTLRLTFTLVFGTRQEAAAAARQINAAHRSVRGVDRSTGLAYDARDPDLLLWVHASLISSFLLFERLTVGRLDAAGRQRFHQEATTMASLLGLPAARIPPTVSDLDAWVDATIDSRTLRPTASSHLVSAVMRGKAGGTAGHRSRAAGFLALHMLPPALRDLYGVDHGRSEQRKLKALGAAIRVGRLALPARARFIGPAIAASARMRGEEARVSEAAVLTRRRGAELDARQPL